MRYTMDRNFDAPAPIIDKKEADTLDILTEKYTKLIESSKLAKLGTKAGQLVPEKIKKWGNEIIFSNDECNRKWI